MFLTRRRRLAADRDLPGRAVPPKLYVIAVIELLGRDLLTVDEGAVRAAVISDVKSVGPRLDKTVLLRRDPLRLRIETHTRRRASADRQKPGLEIKDPPGQRSRLDP